MRNFYIKLEAKGKRVALDRIYFGQGRGRRKTVGCPHTAERNS